MRDHFINGKADGDTWVFLNIGTPAIYKPERVDDTRVSLPELGKWNDGSYLLSRAYLGEQSRVSARVDGWDYVPDKRDKRLDFRESGGAGVGFYGGCGGIGDYVLLALTDDTAELRIDSLAQHGAAFMDEGQPQWYVVASCAWEKHFPVEIALKRSGAEYTGFIDGKECLKAKAPVLKGDARALLKSLPCGDRMEASRAVFDWAEVTGQAPTASLAGVVRTGDGRPIAGASVHVAAYNDLFTLTGEDGRFEINGAPRGACSVIAAAEGYLFARAEKTLFSGAANEIEVVLERETAQNLPRHEYNNPAFDRSDEGWLCLNGTWQFSFDPDEAGVDGNWHQPEAHRFDRAIRVPFSWASLMGFGEEHLVDGDALLQSHPLYNNYGITGENGWYKRSFTVPASFAGRETVLHIGAAANLTYVWLDGRYIGVSNEEYGEQAHALGYLEAGSVHTLVIRVRYPHHIPSHNMGKQIFWFSNSPGIWQSVWIEAREEAHIEQLKLTPSVEFENGAVLSARVEIDIRAVAGDRAEVELIILPPDGGDAQKLVLRVQDGHAKGDAEIENPALWGYKQGKLYSVVASLMADGRKADSVKSYFGLRKAETRWLPGHSPRDTDDTLSQYQYVYLNDKPFYVIGILDQCYNAFGVYTYRCLYAEGEAGKRGSIAYDIDRTLAYGYNLSRVHIKENEPLWYYECDKRGLPVWTEHPSNFYATPEDTDWTSAYMRELDGMARRLYNHPCIVMASSINESWGVEGWHGRTPWTNELRARFMENAARELKRRWPHVLVCDNSGFGKTGACEINDFHLYPHDHWKAKDIWTQLTQDCYPGSAYNCINRARGRYCVGDAVQTGKPVLISEFLHVNGIDMQLRQFEKIAGYLRMNVASHEVENSAPLTGERFERDYGYVNRRMQSGGYDMVNNMDMVILDRNRIERANAGDTFSCDVYTSHFAWTEAKRPKLCWSLTGVDALGRYRPNLLSGGGEIAFTPFCVEKQAPILFALPADMKGAYLFAWIEDGNQTLCENYIQIEILRTAACPDILREIAVTEYASKSFSGFGTDFRQGDASLVCGTGSGYVEYEIEVPPCADPLTLVFEAGARRGVNGIRVTDERKYGTVIDVSLDGQFLAQVKPADDASDERALFSNSTMGGEPFDYFRLGQYGYGERFELELPRRLLGESASHTIRFTCGEGGMTLYGNRMGRYGMNPSVIRGNGLSGT